MEETDKGDHMERYAEVGRKTGETDITVAINIDGTGKSNIDTGIGFFDHMLDAFARHGLFDLTVKVKGDLNVDGHHTVEDTGIVLGQAIAQAIGDKKGIKRYGYMILPMDETLALSAVDLCGRPYFVMDATFNAPMVGDFDTQLVNEFFYALSYSAAMNLHLRIITGMNEHHKIEAMFKAFAKALDSATSYDERITDVLSTKGSLG
jgi:imidazoleglycerol-phosphate dehydratase